MARLGCNSFPNEYSGTWWALWEGGSRWEVTPEGTIAVCSLKKLAAAYIAENLGRVCHLTPEDKSVVLISEEIEPVIDTTSGCKQIICDSCTSSDFATTMERQRVNEANNQYKIAKTIPYSNFNFTNYGKIYAKTDDTNIPGDDSGLRFAHEISRYDFKFRYL